MLRVIVQNPPKPIGEKGWKQQVLGFFFYDAPGVESPFAVPIPVLVGKDEPGFAPGEYTLCPSSFAPKSDSYGKLALGIGRVVLVPKKKA